MNVILYLASRYLRFKASDRGISTIALIAFLTIVISGAAAVVILSAANGFHYSFMEKLMTKDAHISLIGTEDGIPDYEDLVVELKDIEGVTGAYPYFDGQALLKGNLNLFGAFLKGIPEELYREDADFRDKFQMMEGEFDLSDPKSIILGENLALNLGVSIGSWIRVTVYNEEFFSLQYKFQVEGIFSAGYAEYDSSLAFIEFGDAQEIYDSIGKAYGVAVKVDDPMKVENYVDRIAPLSSYYLATWKDMNEANLISLKNEKVMLLIILFVFFIVVFFNILSTMIAMVLDKKEEIGILKAMGLEPGATRNLFLFEGFFLGAIGSSLGVIIGLFFTVTLNSILHGIEKIIDFINFTAYYVVSIIVPLPYPSHFEFFKSTVYYISSFPIKILFGDLAFIILLSVIISTVAVIFPAWTASRMRPVEVLRNE